MFTKIPCYFHLGETFFSLFGVTKMSQIRVHTQIDYNIIFCNRNYNVLLQLRNNIISFVYCIHFQFDTSFVNRFFDCKTLI